MSHNFRFPWLIAVSSVASGVAIGAPPSTSAYFTDAQNSYVQDATSESIGQVNMIACIMSSMRPDALVNQGPYIALVDQNKCDSSKRSSTSSSGSDGASQAANYMTVTVDSTRASNSDPMIVKAWVNDEQNGQPETVFVHISATEAPSTSNPYGAFRLDFCGKANSGGACMMNGFMQGGAGALSYYQTESGGGGGGGGRTTALQLSSVGTSTGSGGLHMVEGDGSGGTQTSAFNFAYDQNYFLRDDGTPNGAQCFSRNAADPATGLSVWRYGLYDSTTGARVDLNSGFPIEYVSGATTYQGYLGYWGLSLPSAATATLVTGSTVQKVDYSSSGGAPTRTSYTILQNGGKLTRYTKKTRTLHELDQIHFNAWVGEVGTSGLPTSNTQYEMFWDDASSMFIATAVMQCTQDGCQTGNLPNNTNIAVDPSYWSSAGGIQGWSQSLGGELFIDLHGLNGPVVSSAITVAYRVQELVYPGDTAVSTLYCVNNCPSAASLSSYFTQSGTPVASPYGRYYYYWYPVPASDFFKYTLDANG
ncbi:MAG: hypothetical protein M3N50_08310, partial [Pseudomonadota bacterium]|nr:hypothetical protein [Pseudomonadota bacterium]